MLAQNNFGARMIFRNFLSGEFDAIGEALVEAIPKHGYLFHQIKTMRLGDGFLLFNSHVRFFGKSRPV